MNMYPPTSSEARACHSLSLSFSKGERGRGCGGYRNKTECQQMCWDQTGAWAKWGGDPNGVAILTGAIGKNISSGICNCIGPCHTSGHHRDPDCSGPRGQIECEFG